MIWRVNISRTARKQLKKLDNQARKSILDFLKNRIETGKDPKKFGDPLRRSLAGLWKYRVGDYRIICDIRQEAIVVLVLRLGHRRKIYGGH